MKRLPVIIGALLAFAVALAVWWSARTPPGIDAKGGDAETLAWVSLATAVVSLLIATVGLVQKLIELRMASSRRS
jgi:hypothetical protein